MRPSTRVPLHCTSAVGAHPLSSFFRGAACFEADREKQHSRRYRKRPQAQTRQLRYGIALAGGVAARRSAGSSHHGNSIRSTGRRRGMSYCTYCSPLSPLRPFMVVDVVCVSRSRTFNVLRCGFASLPRCLVLRARGQRRRDAPTLAKPPYFYARRHDARGRARCAAPRATRRRRR